MPISGMCGTWLSYHHGRGCRKPSYRTTCHSGINIIHVYFFKKHMILKDNHSISNEKNEIVYNAVVSSFRGLAVPSFRGLVVPSYRGLVVPPFRGLVVSSFRGLVVSSFRGLVVSSFRGLIVSSFRELVISSFWGLVVSSFRGLLAKKVYVIKWLFLNA